MNTNLGWPEVIVCVCLWWTVWRGTSPQQNIVIYILKPLASEGLCRYCVEKKCDIKMSGLANSFDLKDEAQAKEYLDTVGVEYRFQCFHEKSPEGCHRLGDFLEAFRKDFDKARAVYKTNCEDYKFGHSCFKIGNYKMLGRACEKSQSESLKYYSMGCDFKHGPSCHNAAQATHKIQKDVVKASKWLEKGCELNDIPSCQLLSSYYIKGLPNFAKNMDKAFTYAKKACDGDHIYGCVNLSIMYQRGEGVTKDEKLAAQYKEKALKLKNEITNPGKQIEFGK